MLPPVLKVSAMQFSPAAVSSHDWVMSSKSTPSTVPVALSFSQWTKPLGYPGADV